MKFEDLPVFPYPDIAQLLRLKGLDSFRLVMLPEDHHVKRYDDNDQLIAQKKTSVIRFPYGFLELIENPSGSTEYRCINIFDSRIGIADAEYDWLESYGEHYYERLYSRFEKIVGKDLEPDLIIDTHPYFGLGIIQYSGPKDKPEPLLDAVAAYFVNGDVAGDMNDALVRSLANLYSRKEIQVIEQLLKNKPSILNKPSWIREIELKADNIVPINDTAANLHDEFVNRKGYSFKWGSIVESAVECDFDEMDNPIIEHVFAIFPEEILKTFPEPQLVSEWFEQGYKMHQLAHDQFMLDDTAGHWSVCEFSAFDEDQASELRVWLTKTFIPEILPDILDYVRSRMRLKQAVAKVTY